MMQLVTAKNKKFHNKVTVKTATFAEFELNGTKLLINDVSADNSGALCRLESCSSNTSFVPMVLFLEH